MATSLTLLEECSGLQQVSLSELGSLTLKYFFVKKWFILKASGYCFMIQYFNISMPIT